MQLANATTNWPEQSDPRFPAFISREFARFATSSDVVSGDENNCSVSPKTFSLLPHQKFLGAILSPRTKIRKVLVAASTGSGKTVVVANILCNYLDPKQYPRNTPRPSRIVVVTQTSALKEQLYDVLQNKMPCVGSFKPLREISKGGRLSEDLHPYWWAEKWIKAHAIPVEVWTYGQAVRRPASAFNGAVLVLDEAHTLMDTSALAPAQRGIVLELKHRVATSNPWVLVGLTGSPLGQKWQHFVGIHNMFAVSDAHRITEEQFAEDFLGAEEMDRDTATHLRKCGVARNDTVYTWKNDSKVLLKSLAQKIAPYMFFYDASLDPTRFARPETIHEIVTPSSSSEFMKRVFRTKARRLRATFQRTRLVASDVMHRGTMAVVDSIDNMEDLRNVAPVLYRLIQNLAVRQGKAVVYTDTVDAFGAMMVYELLKKFAGEHGAPLFSMLSRDGVSMQRRNLVDFNRHEGTGKSSAVLVLGAGFSTGVDVNGAAREMHVLNVLPNDAMEMQVKGRVLRNCSHARLPRKADWTIKYMMYEMDFPESCDAAVYDYRQKSDSIMKALADIVKFASFGCRLMSKHHGHSGSECY